MHVNLVFLKQFAFGSDIHGAAAQLGGNGEAEHGQRRVAGTRRKQHQHQHQQRARAAEKGDELLAPEEMHSGGRRDGGR